MSQQTRTEHMRRMRRWTDGEVKAHILQSTEPELRKCACLSVWSQFESPCNSAAHSILSMQATTVWFLNGHGISEFYKCVPENYSLSETQMHGLISLSFKSIGDTSVLCLPVKLSLSTIPNYDSI